MCGRYRLSSRKQVIEEYFDASGDEDWSPRYNIAPTQSVPVIRQHPKEPQRVLSLMRWGLIPSWAKDISGSAGMINARSESAATKPAFRDPMKFRRCLIPADGFYEWRRTGHSKQPFCFEVDDGQLFAFAGLWDRWKAPSGQWIRSCSILTTTPNAVASQVHDRMPVILSNDDYDRWLDPGMTETATVTSLLKPFGARLMRCYPVSGRLNQVQNDDMECSKPISTGDTAAKTIICVNLLTQKAEKLKQPKKVERNTQPPTLKGWQQIAAFLGHPAAVVQRWASEGMPVRRQGRFAETTPDELNAWLGKESGKPVHVATDTTDLAAELKRGLSFVRSSNRSKKVGR